MEGGLTIIDIYKNCSKNRSHLCNNLLVKRSGQFLLLLQRSAFAIAALPVHRSYL